MMGDFRRLSESVWASPQITLGDIAKAAETGVTLIVNSWPSRSALIWR